ncbi:MAG: QueT transporter family protein [Christensenellales bacterium]|jgi:uncharacterized membrane protein
MSIKTRFITRSALIAAIYAALTLIIRPLSYGPVQFRFSEVLVALPVLMPEAIPGLTIGCLIANVLSHYGIYDMIFGTLATLVAAILTYLMRKKIYLAAAPPVILNALVVPLIFILSGSAGFSAYLINFINIFISEAVIVYALAIPLTLLLKKKPGLYL